MMTEPDVALTDYGLAVECGVMAWLLYRGSGQVLRRWFALFFAATSAASLAGGTVHGFFLDSTTAGARILWPAALIAIGAVALAGWGIGAHILFSTQAARWISRLASLEFAFYAAVVVFGAPTFGIALLNYLPAALFLLLAFGCAYLRLRQSPILLGVAGMLLTSAAAGVQHGQLALHPRYFNHNALYHLIQAVALLMIFVSGRWFSGARGNSTRRGAARG